MSLQNLGTDRYAALKATEKFPEGTIGYGVHQGIRALYYGLLLPYDIGVGGFRNRYSARIGELFLKPEVQALMAKPISNSEANRQVAQMEFEYWTSVKNDPNSSFDDRWGAEMALRYSIDVRAEIQKNFANGQEIEAAKLIGSNFLGSFLGAFGFGVWNVGQNLVIDTGDLITSLQASFNEAKTITSPIILDLDGNGVDTISKSAGVHFDLDGNKFAETTGWVGKNDGLLVLDRNSNGKIDNGSELFGNNTILKNGSKAAHGFAALTEFDINKDGKINASDTAYTQLRVWKDSNSNGVVDTGELLTLTQAGVKSLNTGFTDQTITDAQGNQHLQVGNYTRNDGSTRAMNDVWFATDTARAIAQDIVTVNATIAALPELQGFGNVHSLRQAMARDTTSKLQNLVKQFSTTTDTAARHALFQQILFSWSGADKYAVNSRGSYLTDGRILYAIEAFLGERFTQGGNSDPAQRAAATLQTTYDQLYQTFYAQLMAQTHFKGLYDSINLSWNSTTNQFDLDVSNTVKALQTKYTANAITGAAWMQDFGNSLKTNGDFGKQVLAALQKQGNIAGQGFAFALATMGYNTINGTASNDTLNGSNGKDNWLVGNAGNDNISGDNGNDIINGGLGNDTLNGGYGNDIYIFNKGDGQDTISDYDPTVGNIDTIRFGTGILPTDITLRRDQYNLYLSVNGTTDIITIQNWAYGTNYQIEKVEFANGTSWDK
ncbi:calcium-binding protein, partial [Cronbergia sp. UHCC 0137]|uniref:calcium-binding protein n=1 Tax=Cronbergia sp. UHCC 0137 TaxID=3110239 RepID=UPI002B20CAE6